MMGEHLKLIVFAAIMYPGNTAPFEIDVDLGLLSEQICQDVCSLSVDVSAVLNHIRKYYFVFQIQVYDMSKDFICDRIVGC